MSVVTPYHPCVPGMLSPGRLAGSEVIVDTPESSMSLSLESVRGVKCTHAWCIEEPFCAFSLEVYTGGPHEFAFCRRQFCLRLLGCNV